MNKYLLVQWPESQHFIGHPKCYLCQSLDWNEKEYDSAYFVPEDVYDEVMNEI